MKTGKIKLVILAASSTNGRQRQKTIMVEDTILSALDALDTIDDFYDYTISDYEAKDLVRTAIKTGYAETAR